MEREKNDRILPDQFKAFFLIFPFNSSEKQNFKQRWHLNGDYLSHSWKLDFLLPVTMLMRELRDLIVRASPRIARNMEKTETLTTRPAAPLSRWVISDFISI